MNKTEFDRLMERYLEGNVSEEERAKIEAWLDVMKTEDRGDLDITPEMEDRLFERITNKNSSVGEVTRLVPQKSTGGINWALGIAASVLVLFLAAYIWSSYNGDLAQPAIVNENGWKKVFLNDGSIVWLREGSEFAYVEKTDEGIRFGELQGEGLFEIAKDPARPFVVQCGNARVTVVGTSFTLKSSPDEVELNVLTGKVLFDPGEGDPVPVLPSERIVSKAGDVAKRSVETSELTQAFAGTSYLMRFENAMLKEVAERLERKFNVSVRFSEPTTNACRITADFTDQSLKSTLQMITEVLGGEFHIDGKNIIFDGIVCD